MTKTYQDSVWRAQRASRLALTTADASAAIVCNGAGECRHSHHTYHYRQGRV